MNPNTRATLGPTVTLPLAQATPFDNYGGKWCLFGTTVPLNPTMGIPGVTGRAIDFDTKVVRSRVDASVCSGLVGNFDEFRRQCGSTSTIMCSQDYMPAGAQQLLGPLWQTQSPRLEGCPRTRMVTLNNNGNVLKLTPRRGPSSTTISLMNWPGNANATVPLEFASDVTSFIDVYDSDFASTADSVRYESHGTTGGHFKRFTETYVDLDNRRMVEWMQQAEQPRTAVSLANARTSSWWGLKAVKMYDSGLCSVVLPWRTILNEMVFQVEDQLAHTGGNDLSAVPLSRHVLTPVLRTSGGNLDGSEENQGMMAYTLSIYASQRVSGFTGRVRLNMSLNFQLTVANQTPRFDVISFTLRKDDGNWAVNLAQGLGIANVDATIAGIRATVEAKLRDGLRSVISAGANGQVMRANYRPEGVELVLVDQLNDPRFPFLKAQGLCNKVSTTTSGQWTAVFDPPSPEDLAPFRDAKSPDWHLSLPTNGDFSTCWGPGDAPRCGLLKR